MTGPMRLLLCGLGVLSVGCVSLDGPTELHDAVERSWNADLQRSAALSMNTLALILSPLPPEVSRSVWHIRWFHAGVYRIAQNPDAQPSSAAALTRLRRFSLPGWSRMMYARETPNEIVVLARSANERMTDLALLIHDGQEITIVRLVGNVDRFLEDRSGNDELLASLEAMQTMFNHLGMAQVLMSKTTHAHRDNETHVRTVMKDAGWLEPSQQDREDGPVLPDQQQGDQQ
jgi:hypothetical protein